MLMLREWIIGGDRRKILVGTRLTIITMMLMKMSITRPKCTMILPENIKNNLKYYHTYVVYQSCETIFFGRISAVPGGSETTVFNFGGLF